MEGDRHRNPLDHEAPDARGGETGRRPRTGERRGPVLGGEQPALRGQVEDTLDLRHRRRLRRPCRIVDRRQRLLVESTSAIVVLLLAGKVAEQGQQRPGPAVAQTPFQQLSLSGEARARRHPFLSDASVKRGDGPPSPVAEGVVAGRLAQNSLVALARRIGVT